ncbi:MAG: mannose-6-phosphate isomerase [Actinobacteria bacterium]|nr:mannose-6-phosphate isomerase [Actinomycetota bacterium]
MADDLILDDPVALVAADPGLMLRAVASSGAQVRIGLDTLDRRALAQLASEGRPRAVVVCGMGGSGIVGAVLAALASRSAAIPVVAINDSVLPAWVGAVDVVIAVSCSGETEETLSSAAEAGRRGSRLVAIGAEGSSLHRLAQSFSGSVVLAVDAQGRMPRASLWTLLTPLLMVGESLDLVSGSEPALMRAADRLDDVARRCGVEVPLEENEAKTLGLAVAESLPLLWGSGELGAVAAYRFACQLNENAQIPAIHGAVPEAVHNQVVAFEAPQLLGDDVDDIFRDRVSDPDPSLRMRLVLLRDAAELEPTAARADLAVDLATARGVNVSTIRAVEGHPVERLADLVGVADWASVYAALSLGVDPTPILPIVELKERLAARAHPRLGQ